MFITNVSSAGFLIEISGVSILMDPWFVGQGFLNGWAPLSHSTLTDFPKTIDFLWVSHEHPDHFSPPSLQALSKHLKYLPKVIFQETVDNRVANWFIKNRFKVKILKNLQEIKIDELEFRLQKFGLYDSILQIRNKKECFTNLNDALISSKRDLRACDRFAGERHHVMTSQYGIANAGYAISDEDGWEEAKNKKLSFFMEQLKDLHPHICIPAASSVHFCADDNLYMNDHRVHPSCFIKEKRFNKKGTQILLPLPSKRINSTDRKAIKKTNELFESYYESLLKDTKNLVMHYQEKCE
ncbi:MBL fold metallo-hydrolase, partial [Prochlorococcus sp. AH-736-F09]|nr:MBL fold metallo-hydrolase [Prochlorococcus sp. AH-736-F09]